MNQDGFDDIIKDRLKGYNAEFPSADIWEAYEQASANLENKISDDEFDEAVRETFVDQKVSYNSAHWKIMKSQLKISEERKRTVYISKILEIAAIFLIFITAFKWPVYKYPVYPEKSKTTLNKSEFASRVIQETKSENKKANPVAFKKLNAKSNVNDDLSSSEIFTEAIVATDLDVQLNELNNAESIETSSISTEAHIDLGSDSNTDVVFDKAETVNDQNVLKTTSNEADTNQRDKESETIDVALTAIPSISVEKLSSEYPMMVPMDLLATKEKSKYYIGATASADVNLINTPFDKIYSIASYNKEALNNSYGLTLSKKKGLLELETGAIYTKRAYQPETISEKVENEFYFTEKTFNKIEFDIVNVPINLKYHFINKPKWSAYLVAGAAVNLIMNAKYAIKEVQSLNRPAPGEYISPESRLQEKPFIKGLLNKDNLNDNYFATLGFGFGIEKKISNTTSIYLQPSYQRQVLSGDIGIGPNKDKIHTSSLAFGVKTALN